MPVTKNLALSSIQIELSKNNSLPTSSNHTILSIQFGTCLYWPDALLILHQEGVQFPMFTLGIGRVPALLRAPKLYTYRLQ